MVRPFPNPVKAVEGKDFVIHCPVSGYPIEEIAWSKDGVSLYSDLHRKVFTNGTLLIMNVVKDLAEGVYQCTAKNRQGFQFRLN